MRNCQVTFHFAQRPTQHSPFLSTAQPGWLTRYRITDRSAQKRMFFAGMQLSTASSSSSVFQAFQAVENEAEWKKMENFCTKNKEKLCRSTILRSCCQGWCALYADYVAIYFSELLCLEALVFCSRMVDFEQSCSGKDGFLCKSTAGRVAGSEFFFLSRKSF